MGQFEDDLAKEDVGLEPVFMYKVTVETVIEAVDSGAAKALAAGAMRKAFGRAMAISVEEISDE